MKYSDRVDSVDLVAHALANSGRRAVVTRLSNGSATSSELAELLGVGLPAAHKQLALLRAAGLIESTKIGRTVTNTLRPDGLDDLEDWIATRKSFWSNQFDALAHAVEDE
ncbi:MAG: winged helix-turn-helix domain-containing protein [Actinomycetota bacterium]|nr:winged helix-turn-helix domain-containing protein [Actinomycetota bacterium]